MYPLPTYLFTYLPLSLTSYLFILVALEYYNRYEGILPMESGRKIPQNW